MEFKLPADKRKSLETNFDPPDTFASSQNTKKKRNSSSSHLPNTQSNDVHFNDNFSQYFHTQFIRQISKDEAKIGCDRRGLSDSSKCPNKSMIKNGFNLTQFVGFSQTLSESQFETTITPGQRYAPNAFESFQPPSTQLFSQQNRRSSAHILNQSNRFSDDDEADDNANDVFDTDNEEVNVQSSQVFLKEVTALQLNISSIIDETLMVNKIENSDEVEAADKFTVYKSNITLSEYVQIKRTAADVEPHESIHANELTEQQATDDPIVGNTEAIEDKMFAEFLKNNNDFDNAVNLNECIAIDPNSSALESSLVEEHAEAIDNQAAIENENRNPRVLETQRTKLGQQMQQMAKEFDTTVVERKPKGPVTPRPITAANFYSLGPFFGLPLKVKALIKEFKGINDLYDWQKECLQLPAIDLKQNLIYALPTSGGKTLVSEILILREVLCRRRNCLFILPYVSIVQEKVWALSPFALHLDFLIEEYAAGKGSLPPRKRRQKKSVYIATIEKALAMLDSLIETNRANEIGLVIVDELHIIGEPGRGAVMESLLTKIQYIKAGIQIVGMSATIGNIKELAEFLNADIYHKDFRPVELREFIKCGSDLLEIKKDAVDIESAFMRDRTVSFGYSENVLKMDPDHIAGLVSEIIPDKSCLIFCPSKKNCENLSTLLCRILSKKYVNHKTNEKANLIKAIESDMGSAICPILAKTIPYGIAYHHSGLTTDERRHLEDAFRLGLLCVICCTSTLAAGVNLPAKRVIIRSPYVGREFITLSKYKQMIGRAGRAGFGESGESILICAARDNQQVMQLLCSPMDEVASQLHHNDRRVMGAMLLSCISLNVASTRFELQKLVSCTLLKVQATYLGVEPAKITDELIAKLIKSKALTAKGSMGISNTSASDIDVSSQNSQESSFQRVIPLSQKKVVLKPSTKLEVSLMGKSSFKSGIDLNKAKIVYADLVQAQRSLVLLDYFHLLHLVTPFDDNNTPMMPDTNIFYTKYSSLTPNQLHTARIIGITDSVAMKLMSSKALKPEQERIVKKFFSTMILNELWCMKPVSEIANSFGIGRGLVQNLMGMAAIEASCLLKFCEELEEFWAFRDLFKNLSQRLSNICTTELVPLMQLPCVKLGRAKQLYNSGYKKIEDIARAKPRDLVAKIEHMNNRVANQLISAAKVLVLEKLENLREEVQECMDVYTSSN